MLDIGSGTGVLSFSIATLNPHCQVLGIDPSNEYVESARNRNPFPERVNFEIGDALHLRFSDAKFEAALSLLAFNFIPDYRKALREAMRVTEPGGCVSAAVWEYADGMRMLRIFWDAAVNLYPAAEKSNESHMPLCRAGELEELWKEGGLKGVAARPLDITLQFASFEDYWEPFSLGQGPAGVYLRNLDADRRAALRVEIKRKLGLASEAAPFSLPARAWAVRGIVPHRP